MPPLRALSLAHDSTVKVSCLLWTARPRGSIRRHYDGRPARQGRAVDFWTYTCINWLRTLPYVRAWAEKYKITGWW